MRVDAADITSFPLLISLTILAKGWTTCEVPIIKSKSHWQKFLKDHAHVYLNIFAFYQSISYNITLEKPSRQIFAKERYVEQYGCTPYYNAMGYPKNGLHNAGKKTKMLLSPNIHNESIQNNWTLLVSQIA